MFDRFTDRARKVMGLARQASQELQHEYIGTEHILLGLVREDAGVAAAVLRNLDVDVEKIKHEVRKIVQTGPNPITLGQLPFTPRAKTVLEKSCEEAKTLGHNYIGTEHLLLGCLAEQEGVAAQVLMNLGLKLEEVREEILELLGGPTCLEVETKELEKLVSAVESARKGGERLLYEHLSEPVEVAIAFACAESIRGACAAVPVGTGHLLLGLIHEGGSAARVLRECGVPELERARAAVEAASFSPLSHERLGPRTLLRIVGRLSHLGKGGIPFTESARDALGRAADEASIHGHKRVRTEHLLLGLLATDGAANRALEKLGVDTNGRVKEKSLESLREKSGGE